MTDNQTPAQDDGWLERLTDAVELGQNPSIVDVHAALEERKCIEETVVNNLRIRGMRSHDVPPIKDVFDALDEWKGIADRENHARTTAREEATKYRNMLGEILAIIHRDGGHAVVKYGIDTASQKATKIALALLDQIAALKEQAGEAPSYPVGREEVAREIAEAMWGPEAASVYFDTSKMDVRYRDSMAAADRVLALLSRADTGWRAMRDAPKDGTWIHAWREPPKMTGPTWEPLIYVRWDNEEEGWVWPCDTYQVFTVRGRELADMAISDGDYYTADDFTHFRPLPASPSSREG